MKYIPLFIFIQVVALILAITGLPVCAYLAYVYGRRRMWRARATAGADGGTPGNWHFPAWAWVWSNDVDGVDPSWYTNANPTWSASKRIFRWTALRNPVNNFRFVRGVSKVGRPLWRKTWGAKPGGYYVQAGWNASGFPVLSLGRNSNVY